MFKILTLGILFYLLYKLVWRPSLLDGAQQKDQEKITIKKEPKSERDEGEYIDYEEVE